MESTWHIHIRGLVQGVGFRPFVHLTAKAYRLSGWVSNTTDGVHIEFNAVEQNALEFYNRLITKAPALSKITEHHLSKIPEQVFDNFQIVHRNLDNQSHLSITPDFALCMDCAVELKENTNRRYNYPFISCTNCGPRFSILQRLPYDRENTSMDEFRMCSKCKQEYSDIKNRRYFAQTNSCPECAIGLALYNSKGDELTHDPDLALKKVIHCWEQGKIVAIKGIGGYLLTCDATNTEAIETLRKRKHRPSKPFAIMYPNPEFLKEEVELDTMEIGVLESAIAPILLARSIKKNSHIAKEHIAPNLNQLGVMLPYTPLYRLLVEKFGRPIVATSGNISDSPILFEDVKIQSELSRVYDFLLTHNLDLVVPQDDSVMTFSKHQKQKIIIRRSRGLAPNYFNAGLRLSKETILTTGASMKSTFCLHSDDNTYVSQYLGNLENFDTLKSYTKTIQHFLNILRCTPNIIISDLHPDYPCSRYGSQLSEDLNVPFLKVQHHLAHFAAVLGENRLHIGNVPVLGVVWDGTGYGEDGHIWGGEFFIYKDYRFTRKNHFGYFDTVLGDKMAKEPRISALSCCWNIASATRLLHPKFTAAEWQVYLKKLGRAKNLKTSSVGRIFDAVASLLGLMDNQTFEGEAAMHLEALAKGFFDGNALEMDECYFSEKSYLKRISTRDLMIGVIQDIEKGKKMDFIAAKFHCSLARLISFVAKEAKIKKIAFSGGVFQNSLLVDMVIMHLSKDFELFFHKDLPPNDENISFGQLIYYHIKNMENEVSDRV